jgi:hypothetical protein
MDFEYAADACRSALAQLTGHVSDVAGQSVELGKEPFFDGVMAEGEDTNQDWQVAVKTLIGMQNLAVQLTHQLSAATNRQPSDVLADLGRWIESLRPEN